MLKGVLVCAPWEGQHLMVSVRRRCAMCERALAMSKSNVATAKELILMCIQCALESFPDEVELRGLVGGKSYENLHHALLAAQLEMNRN